MSSRMSPHPHHHQYSTNEAGNPQWYTLERGHPKVILPYNLSSKQILLRVKRNTINKLAGPDLSSYSLQKTRVYGHPFERTFLELLSKEHTFLSVDKVQDAIWCHLQHLLCVWHTCWVLGAHHKTNQRLGLRPWCPPMVTLFSIFYPNCLF